MIKDQEHESKLSSHDLELIPSFVPVVSRLILTLSESQSQVVDKRLSVDSPDEDEATPLHFAASKGHFEVVRWLLGREARIRADRYGKTPLDDAAENGHKQVGARVNISFLNDCIFFASELNSLNGARRPPIQSEGNN